MKFISNKIIKLDRELSDLDLFTLEFVKILRKHVNYVIVSGYVSIVLGRARASEDIDIIVPKIKFSKFLSFLKEIEQNGFYCLNSESNKELYEYLNDNLAIRFAKMSTVIPNIELKFAKNKVDDISIRKTVTIRLKDDKIIISNLEMQVAFKECVLKSPKDIEDARHIRNIAKGRLDEILITKYKGMLDEI